MLFHDDAGLSKVPLGNAICNFQEMQIATKMRLRARALVDFFFVKQKIEVVIMMQGKIETEFGGC